jgi:hypothetical protein
MFRRFRAVTVASALVVALTSVSAPGAGATPQYKFYSASAAPSSIVAGSPTAVTVTLANRATSNQPFGSAELTIGSLPAGAVSIGTNTLGWAASLAGSNPAIVLLESGAHPAVAPGKTLSLTLTLTPPTTASILIATVVKQSNDFSGSGNNFNLQGQDPTITVTPAAVTLAFQQQPPSLIQQSVPAKSNFTYMCPSVSVVTSGGQPVSGVPVTINYSPGSADPGLYFGTNQVTASGVTATSGSNGLATFGDTACSTGLAATNLGSGYTLTASSPAATGPVTSSPFSVVQFTCPPTCQITVTSPSTGTKGSITSTPPSSGRYQLLGSFGQGALSCDSSVTTTAGDPLVAQTSAAASGIVTMTFPKAVVNSISNNGTPLMPVCAGAGQSFPGSSLTTSTTFPYQGLLQNCPANYLTAGGFQLCVLSRVRNPGASETIQIYASDLSDPSFW